MFSTTHHHLETMREKRRTPDGSLDAARGIAIGCSLGGMIWLGALCISLI